MSKASLAVQKTALAQIVAVEALIAKSQLETLVPLARDLAQWRGELSSSTQRHERLLQDLLPDLPERARPFRSGQVVHLPQTASEHAPMLRIALQKLFPAYYAPRPWSDVELGELRLGAMTLRLLTSGPGLSVEEADVFLALLQIAQGRTDEVVQTSTWQILSFLGRSSGGDSSEALFKQLDRLTHTHFSTTDTKGRKIGRQWLALRDYATLAPTAPHLIRYVIDSRFAALFGQGRAAWTPVDLAKRKSLDGRARLARWLALVLSSFGSPNTTPIERLYVWSGSSVQRARDFRADILRACKKLEEGTVGFLVPGKSHITKGPSGFLLHTQKCSTKARFTHRHAEAEALSDEGVLVLLAG